MNPALLLPKVQQYISRFQGDVVLLAFSGSPFESITVQELIQQIEGKQKTKKKLPLWHHTGGILYPPKISVEQTSSQETAAYKATLVTGEDLIDITGGWGVDSYYFSKQVAKVFYFELNSSLAALAQHNFTVLRATNITCQPGNGIKGIKNRKAAILYVDPARRDDVKGKVFMLSDCTPNVPKNLDYLMERCTTLLIKASPMLDIAQGIKELKHVCEIHCVAVQNEMKELLFIVKKPKVATGIITTNTPLVHTINILKDGLEQRFSFLYKTAFKATYSLPLTYLYEPNAAILKSGGFQAISETLQVAKIAMHSHLYTSYNKIDFPGRCFKVSAMYDFNKKDMKRVQQLGKINITTRNFPLSVAKLRKKYKLKEGGTWYVFFTIVADNTKKVLVCQKV